MRAAVAEQLLSLIAPPAPSAPAEHAPARFRSLFAAASRHAPQPAPSSSTTASLLSDPRVREIIRIGHSTVLELHAQVRIVCNAECGRRVATHKLAPMMQAQECAAAAARATAQAAIDASHAARTTAQLRLQQSAGSKLVAGKARISRIFTFLSPTAGVRASVHRTWSGIASRLTGR